LSFPHFAAAFFRLLCFTTEAEKAKQTEWSKGVGQKTFKRNGGRNSGSKIK